MVNDNNSIIIRYPLRSYIVYIIFAAACLMTLKILPFLLLTASSVFLCVYRVTLDETEVSIKSIFHKLSYPYSSIKALRRVIVSGRKDRGIELQFYDGKKIQISNKCLGYSEFITELEIRCGKQPYTL